jgi:hypothetical protein
MKSVASAPASERKSRDSRDSDRENLEILEILTPASEREGGREGGKGDGRTETLHELDARDFQRNLEILEILITGGGSALDIIQGRGHTLPSFIFFIAYEAESFSFFLLRTRQNQCRACRMLLVFIAYEAESYSFFFFVRGRIIFFFFIAGEAESMSGVFFLLRVRSSDTPRIRSNGRVLAGTKTYALHSIYINQYTSVTKTYA